MKLTKKLEAEIKDLMDDYWNLYLGGKIKTWSKFLVDDYRNIGGTEEEIWNSKKEILDYTNRMMDQMKGLTELRNKQIQIISYDPYFMVHELLDVYIKVDDEWTFYQKFRLSSLIQKIDSQWKVLHQHGSYPDSKTQEGEAFAVDEIKVENRKLKDAIKRRTIQLEEKNRELEIETALEKVRAVAMGMNKPDDLLNICQTLHKQFLSLGFSEMRNTMINIHNDAEKSFINYDYSDMIGKSTNHLTYTIHPLIEKQIKKIRSAKDAFSETYFSGKDLTEWKKFRKKIGEKADPRLATSKGLYYYFYSIGIGSIGISTFGPISKEKKILLKRFRNVFNLSYQRYVDVTNAEVQVKEAKIETALERVRARSMAMHNTSELQSVIHTVHNELLHLNIAIDGGSFIAINSDIESELRCWGSGGTADTTEEVHIPLYKKPFCTNLINRIKKGPGFFTEEYSPKEKKDFFAFLFKHQPWSKLNAKQKKETLSSPGGYTRSCCVSKHTSIFIINHHGEIFSADDNEILQRFAKVFEQTYTRFLDLQRAEAQAREAEIETALEKVRSRTMAMQRSDELADAAALLFQQVRKLGIETYTNGFNIWDEEHNVLTSWMSNPTGAMNPPFIMPLDDGQHKIFYEAWKKNIPFLEDDLTGKKINEHYKHLWSFPLIKKAFAAAEKAGIKTPDRQVHNAVIFPYGYVLFVTLEPNPQNQDIFKRFGKVFEQTYTRFLDLQKAEAQTREAEIELALERVRARTMAMHQSMELAETALLLFQQLQALGLLFSRTGFYIWRNDADLVEGWTSNGALDEILPSLLLPYKEDEGHRGVYKASLRGELSYEQVLTGEKLNQHYQWLMSQPTAPMTLKKSKESGFIRLSKQYKYAAIFKQGYLMVISVKSQANAIDLLKRFAKVFEQTYTRFLDLQKAEAQAREAKIEVSLERVRSRAMAMHKTDELLDAGELVYKELTVLGITSMAVSYAFVNEQKKNALYYGINPVDGKIPPVPFVFPHTETEEMRSVLKSWKKREAFKMIELDEEATLKHQTWVGAHMQTILAKNNIPFTVDEFLAVSPQTAVIYTFNFKQGYIFIIGEERLSAMQEEIVLRFTKVFEMTYRRFLDLQKAEAQARESQIEAALEKVRSRSLAMHKTDELQEVVTVVLERMTDLNIELDTININIFKEDSHELNLWTAAPGQKYAVPFHLPFIAHPFHTDIFTAKENGLDFFTKTYSLNEKNSYFNYTFEHSDFKYVPEAKKKLIMEGRACTRSMAITKNAGIIIIRYAEKPFSDSENEILKRFAKVFEQAYTRFLDLQKAEAQARESQIEAALEKIRSRSLAMHRSDELKDVIAIMFEKLNELNVLIGTVGIWLFNKAKMDSVFWVGNDLQQPSMVSLPYDAKLMEEDTNYRDSWQAWISGENYINKRYTSEQKNKYFNYVFANNNVEVIPAPVREIIMKAPAHIASLIVEKNSSLFFDSWQEQSYSEASIDVFKKVSKVFEQAYVRFLDLQKAEAQAKEAQIQLALERVRARTMSMQKSDELADAAQLLYHEFATLGINTFSCGYMFIDEESKTQTGWFVLPDGVLVPNFVVFPLTGDHVLDNRYKDWQEKIPIHIYEIDGEVNKEHHRFLADHVPSFMVKDMFSKMPERIVFHCANFSVGYLLILATELLTPQEQQTLIRFAKVFEMTYRRFLDLQKAEAQAREAQIELGLERVRARAMAMQNSDELNELIGSVFTELTKLDLVLTRCVILIYEGIEKGVRWWMANSEAPSTPMNFFVKYADLPFFNEYIKGWQDRSLKWQYILEAENKIKTDDFLFNETELSIMPQFVIEGMRAPDHVYLNASFNNFGNLTLASLEPLSDEHFDILLRFAKVFDLTYTRFNDLQKAEAQARESQIQLALERVRARTMAMQHSDELAETASLLFKQISDLGMETWTSGFNIWEKDDTSFMSYSPSPEGGITTPYSIPSTVDGFFKKIYKAKKRGEEFLVFESSGTSLANTYKYMKTLPVVKDVLKGIEDAGFQLPAFQINHCTFFAQGFLLFITLEPYPEAHDIFNRFSKVFEQTYTRFLDLQKAEAQAKEAQIEAALEKVRSRSMGMQKSEELKEVIKVVYEQFVHLNINVEHTGFIMDYKERDDMHIWLADQHLVPSEIFIPYFDSSHWNSFREAKEKGTDFFPTLLDFEEKNKFYKDLFALIPGIPEETIDYYFRCPGLAGSTVLLDNVSLYIENFQGIPYSDEENKILMRFGKVFQQTYTRFLDLQKAEAQTREAQIETALERTRTQSMIMQHSNELDVTLRVFHEQVLQLNIPSAFSFLWLPDEGKNKHLFWAIWEENKNETIAFKDKAINYPLDRNEPATAQCLIDWKSDEPVYSYAVQPEGVENYFATWHELIDGVEKLKPEFFPGGLYYVEAFMKYGCFGVMVETDLKDEKKKILYRFAVEFERTYARFLDLQKAEAQAREAKIEAALERVRSRTMAMQRSDELPEAANLLFQQMQALGMPAWSTGYCIWDDDKKAVTLWMSSEGVLQPSFRAPLTEDSSFINMREAYERGEGFHVEAVGGDELVQHYQYMRTLPIVGDVLDSIIEAGHPLPTFQIFHCVYFSQGFLLFITYEPVPDAHEIFKRFGKVFDQTYTRFLDLQKAEAQAREAQVEAALEKVRSRMMSMHRSDELSETAAHLFAQLNQLGIKPYRCNIVIVDKAHDNCKIWATTNNGEVIPLFASFPLTETTSFAHMYDAWKNKEKRQVLKLFGEERVIHTKYISQFSTITEYMPGEVDFEKIANEAAVFSNFFFKQGFLFIHTIEEMSEANMNIIQRFTNVFEQTYTRFLDLQKAETHAREATRQASLDRVRGEIASMRSTEDLQRITPLIFNELTTLGVPFFRCGVFIINESENMVHVYLSAPDGHSLGVLNLPFESNELTANSVKYWREGKVYHHQWNKEEFISWTKSMIKMGQVQNPETYQGSAAPPDKLDLHFVPFTQGMLYVGNSAQLSEVEIDLVKSLAKAFSIAYARYEDFTNLEYAKLSIENTLSELKSTQKQLVQSEKMASLGELTAGIAHEIQNPLNFVNNFSEVSKELLDEMKEEMEKGHLEDVKQIMQDVIQNLEKINHHGKRADGIVKGMLQHSQSSKGQKQPTDINALCDEYLRLSYHGLRAKDKSFNADFKTDFDKSIGKINIIPQDIGRVVLNLINNAFYAVAEKKKVTGNNYDPTVSISTKKLSDSIEIKVSDNGNGIPQNIVDKIFQPFFTTKPTGQGTGLGLSLSYDIVKAHGGELRVDSRENEGTTLIIQLPFTKIYKA